MNIYLLAAMDWPECVASVATFAVLGFIAWVNSR